MEESKTIGRLLLWFLVAAMGGWALFGRPAFREELRQRTRVQRLVGNVPLRDGDLIFQTSQSAQSQAIQAATHSPYSHCGLLYQAAGKWQVFEAVQPVRLTPLAEWIVRGQGGHFVVKRLRDAATALTPANLAYLRAAGQPLLGRGYDVAFGWSDDRIYCSELIWKVYDRGLHRQLGQLQRLGDFDLRSPAVQAKLRERYGNTLPLNEPVISPASIFASPELVTVVSK